MERVYPKNAWVTPSELFKPFYGYTVANFMINQMENRQLDTLRIVEIGPGTGTLADSILDFYKNYSLDLYRNCEYILVEISPQLADKCEQVLKHKHK
jgi:SAM-dependent MidA family methyltransferase